MSAPTINVYGSDICSLRTKAATVLAVRAAFDGLRVMLTERDAGGLRSHLPTPLVPSGGLRLYNANGIPKDRFVIALDDGSNGAAEAQMDDLADGFDLVVASVGKAPRKGRADNKEAANVLVGACDGKILQETKSLRKSLKKAPLIWAIPERMPKTYTMNIERVRQDMGAKDGDSWMVPLFRYVPFTVPASEDFDEALWATAAEITSAIKPRGAEAGRAGRPDPELLGQALNAQGEDVRLDGGPAPVPSADSAAASLAQHPSPAGRLSGDIDGYWQDRQQAEAQAQADTEHWAAEDNAPEATEEDLAQQAQDELQAQEAARAEIQAQVEASRAAARAAADELGGRLDADLNETAQRLAAAEQETLGQEPVAQAADEEQVAAEHDAQTEPAFDGQDAAQDPVPAHEADTVPVEQAIDESDAQDAAAISLDEQAPAFDAAGGDGLGQEQEQVLGEVEGEVEVDSTAAGPGIQHQPGREDDAQPEGAPAEAPPVAGPTEEGQTYPQQEPHTDATTANEHAAPEQAHDVTDETVMGGQAEQVADDTAPLPTEAADADDNGEVVAAAPVAPDVEQAAGAVPSPVAQDSADAIEDDAYELELPSGHHHAAGESAGAASHAGDTDHHHESGVGGHAGHGQAGNGDKSHKHHLEHAVPFRIVRGKDQEIHRLVNHDQLLEVIQPEPLTSIIEHSRTVKEFEFPEFGEGTEVRTEFSKLSEYALRKMPEQVKKQHGAFVAGIRGLHLSAKAHEQQEWVLERVLREFANEMFSQGNSDRHRLDHWFLNTVWLTECKLELGRQEEMFDQVNMLLELTFRTKEGKYTQTQINVMRVVMALLLTKIEERMPEYKGGEKSYEVVANMVNDLPGDLSGTLFTEDAMKTAAGTQIGAKAGEAKKAFGDMA